MGKSGLASGIRSTLSPDWPAAEIAAQHNTAAATAHTPATRTLIVMDVLTPPPKLKTDILARHHRGAPPIPSHQHIQLTGIAIGSGKSGHPAILYVGTHFSRCRAGTDHLARAAAVLGSGRRNRGGRRAGAGERVGSGCA